MKLPNGKNAVIDIRKLTDYCLNLEHTSGKHKARLFRAKLDFFAQNAEVLVKALQIVAVDGDAKLGRLDRFGQRYTIDFEFTWQNRSAMLRSGWIIEHGSDRPRLTTCFPL
ncbi:MAG: hypothetical protein HC799_18385 [Limnothrix sp. RL_2_0]|nr:hypothetical protein [Limnothrix sp. RL_2_0]